MPRSYKVCFTEDFDASKISRKPVVFGGQAVLEGVDTGPTTRIHKANTDVDCLDFRQYLIEHEVSERLEYRIGSTQHNLLIRMGKIDAFHSEVKKMLFLSGKKRDILDFCRQHSDGPLMKFRTVVIDMAELLKLLPSVKGVWFSFPGGQLKASALMGHNLESTNDFKHYKTNGAISTLSFFFSHNGIQHPIMVTDDGAIVLQSSYSTRDQEVELALEIKTKLLSKLLS